MTLVRGEVKEPFIVSLLLRSASMSAVAPNVAEGGDNSGLFSRDNSAAADDSGAAARRQGRRAKVLQDFRDLAARDTPRSVLGNLLPSNQGQDEPVGAVKTVTPSYMLGGKRKASKLFLQSMGSQQGSTHSLPQLPASARGQGSKRRTESYTTPRNNDMQGTTEASALVDATPEQSVESIPDLGTPVVPEAALRKPLRRRAGKENLKGSDASIQVKGFKRTASSSQENRRLSSDHADKSDGSINNTFHSTEEAPARQVLRPASRKNRRKTMDHLGNFRDVLPSQGRSDRTDESLPTDVSAEEVPGAVRKSARKAAALGNKASQQQFIDVLPSASATAAGEDRSLDDGEGSEGGGNDSSLAGKAAAAAARRQKRARRATERVAQFGDVLPTGGAGEEEAGGGKEVSGGSSLAAAEESDATGGLEAVRDRRRDRRKTVDRMRHFADVLPTAEAEEQEEEDRDDVAEPHPEENGSGMPSEISSLGSRGRRGRQAAAEAGGALSTPSVSIRDDANEATQQVAGLRGRRDQRGSLGRRATQDRLMHFAGVLPSSTRIDDDEMVAAAAAVADVTAAANASRLSSRRGGNRSNASVRFEEPQDTAEEEEAQVEAAEGTVTVEQNAGVDGEMEDAPPSLAGAESTTSTAFTSGRRSSVGGAGFEVALRQFLQEQQERDSDLGQFVEKVLSPVEARVKKRLAKGAADDEGVFKKPMVPPVRRGRKARRLAAASEEEEPQPPTFHAKHVRWEFERDLRTEAKLTGAAMPALMEISERFAQKTAKYLGKMLKEQDR